MLSIVYYWPHFTTDSMGGESIQIPFLLLSLCLCLSLSLPLLGCENMCVCVCVCVLKNPKIRLTQSHHDVVGIYKTTRCAQLEVCVCVCVCVRTRAFACAFDSLLFSHRCLHRRHIHVNTECTQALTSGLCFLRMRWCSRKEKSVFFQTLLMDLFPDTLLFLLPLCLYACSRTWISLSN